MKEEIYNLINDGAIQDDFVSPYSGDLEDFQYYGKSYYDNVPLAEQLFDYCKDKGVHSFDAPLPSESTAIISVLEKYSAYFDYREHKFHPAHTCDDV